LFSDKVFVDERAHSPRIDESLGANEAKGVGGLELEWEEGLVSLSGDPNNHRGIFKWDV